MRCVAASGHEAGYRGQYPNSPGYPHGSGPGPAGDPMMMQPPYHSGMGPNGTPMMRHGMPPPTQSVTGDGPISVQNPFSEGQRTGGYSRPGYGMPPSGGYDGRSGQYHGRPPPEVFDGPYAGQEGGTYPGRPHPDGHASRFVIFFVFLGRIICMRCGLLRSMIPESVI